jgi:hypothetical protein
MLQRSEVARPNQAKPAPLKKEQSKQPTAEPEISQELTLRANEAHRFVDKMMKTELPMTIEQIVRLSNRDVTQAITSCIKPPRAVSGSKGDTRVDYAYSDTHDSEDCKMICTYKNQIDEVSRGSLTALQMEHNEHDMEAIIDTGSMISVMSRGYYKQYFSNAAINTTIHARLHDANRGSRPFYGLLLNVVLLCGGAKQWLIFMLWIISTLTEETGKHTHKTRTSTLSWASNVSVMMINGK